MAISKDIMKWKPVHTKVLILSQQNLTLAEISSKTGMAVRTISWLKSTPTFKKKYADTIGEAEKELMDGIREKMTRDDAVQKVLDDIIRSVPRAAKKIVEIAERGTSNQRVQFDAAKEILHIAGFKPIDVIQTQQTGHDWTPEEAQLTLEVLKEVEETTKRLSKQESQFLLKRPENNDGQN